MDAPNLEWHDQRPIDSARYALHAWPTIGAVVTGLRSASALADEQVSLELQGQLITAPRSFTTRGDAQEWALRAIERRLLGRAPGWPKHLSGSAGGLFALGACHSAPVIA